MKSKYKLIIITASILMIASTIIYYKFRPVINGKFYSGNRITVSLSIFLDDRELSLDNRNASCTYENETCSLKMENGTLQTKGGHYGEYCFKIIIPAGQLGEHANNLILNLNYLNANDWYISKSDCIIRLYTKEDNTISGNAVINTKYNDNSSKVNKYDINESVGEISLNWGL